MSFLTITDRDDEFLDRVFHDLVESTDGEELITTEIVFQASIVAFDLGVHEERVTLETLYSDITKISMWKETLESSHVHTELASGWSAAKPHPAHYSTMRIYCSTAMDKNNGV